MLTTIMVFLMVTMSIGLISSMFDNSKRNIMNRYCYSECVEGKHYKRKDNMFDIYQ